MSIEKEAFRGGVWFAAVSSASQAVTWACTLIVAKLLLPSHYGLLEMATVLTGYAFTFQELGLGASIIQKEKTSHSELSSAFWLVTIWGVILTCISLLLVDPTVALFQGNEEIRPVAQSVSVLFFIAAITVVPRHLMMKDLKFKQLGVLQAWSAIISSLSMVGLAYAGFGVWTLVLGNIIRDLVRAVLIFRETKFCPSFHFQFSEAKSFLKFGLYSMLAGSLLYLSQKTESFFGGRFFTKEQLGFLLLARQLAEIPNSKILALITSVSFPIFCRYQKLPDKAFAFLKNFLKTTAIFSLPLYIGSAIVGDLAIPIILGQKWSPMVMPFSILCFSYLFCTLLTSPAQTIANAIEKPHLPMVFNFCSFLVLLAGCLVATKSHNFIGLVLPWLVVHGILGLVLFSYVLGKARIPVLPSLAALIKPIIATVFMALSILITRHYLLIENKLVLLVLLIGIGGTVYSSLIYLFEKATFLKMLHALKTKHVADAYNSEEIKA